MTELKDKLKKFINTPLNLRQKIYLGLMLMWVAIGSLVLMSTEHPSRFQYAIILINLVLCYLVIILRD